MNSYDTNTALKIARTIKEDYDRWRYNYPKQDTANYRSVTLPIFDDFAGQSRSPHRCFLWGLWSILGVDQLGQDGFLGTSMDRIAAAGPCILQETENQAAVG